MFATFFLFFSKSYEYEYEYAVNYHELSRTASEYSI